jgi:Lrp/AsnC family leucine-responsive transcriptional regulator
MSDQRRERLDEIDRKLLLLFQDNDRLTLTAVSKAVGLVSSTVNERLKRLVRDGVISGFHARVDPMATGFGLVAFVLVAWEDPKIERVFVEKIRQSPTVVERHHLTGSWNYLLKSGEEYEGPRVIPH